MRSRRPLSGPEAGDRRLRGRRRRAPRYALWLLGPCAGLVLALGSCIELVPAPLPRPVRTPAPAEAEPTGSPTPPADEASPADVSEREPDSDPVAPPASEPGAPPTPAAPSEAPRPPAPFTAQIVDGAVHLRVGLATDLERFFLPAGSSAGPVLATASGRWPVDGALEAAPAAESVRAPTFRLQIAALREEPQAQRLAADVGRRLDQPADAHFDAAVGLYRVRVGRWSRREEAEGAAAVEGFEDAWVVREAGVVASPAWAVELGQERLEIPGRWLSLEPEQGALAWDGRRYRGRLLLFLNDRGAVNVVNELALEEYLRGVVPMELGPELYGRLEALKAQTVAARTYTMRNLRGFPDEGYDICATPRCQVYGGLDVEHPLSDQAIRETAGEVVLFDGRAIDALYSSSCGGRTENVEVVFPGKQHPYLRGVACVEGGTVTLGDPGAGAEPGARLEAVLAARLAPPPEGPAVSAAARRLATLSRAAGLAPAPAELASLEAADVRRYVASLFDLVLHPALLADDGAPASGAAEASERWSAVHLEQARLLAATALAGGDEQPALDRSDLDRLIVALAEVVGLLRIEEVIFASLEDDRLWVGGAGGRRSIPLAGGLSVFRREGDRSLLDPRLDLAPGDPLTLYRLRGEPVAVAEVRVTAPGARTSTRPVRAWRRFRSRNALAERVASRYPGLGFEGFEIAERGPSGRVSRLRLDGAGGKSLEVEGLAVRWLLDVPETWFTARPAKDRQGRAGWTFEGRGLGHGVGLCQIGAFRMAGRGHDYRTILHHYYSDVTLARIRIRRQPGAVASGR